jgi:hypothetical protein
MIYTFFIVGVTQNRSAEVWVAAGRAVMAILQEHKGKRKTQT